MLQPGSAYILWLRLGFGRLGLRKKWSPSRGPNCARLLLIPKPSNIYWIDCLRVGPGPCGPGSGPDHRGRSEGLGQGMAEWTPCGGVQGQTLDGPALGVGLGPDPDRVYASTIFSMTFFILFHSLSMCRSTGRALNLCYLYTLLQV